jgi:Ca2+-binding RTX toxin-like protein
MIVDAGTTFTTAKLNAYGIERFIGNAGNENVTASSTAVTTAFSLSGGAGNDSLIGNGGADTVIGGTGNDSLVGGAGNDRLQDDAGNDTVDGGAGTDTLVYIGTAGATTNLSLSTAQVTGYGTDLIVGVENLTGGSGNDSLTGNTLSNVLVGGVGNDTLSGGDGTDSLQGDAGNDRLDGGVGSDTAIYTGSTGATVNLGLTTAQVTGYGTDTLLNIENVFGTVGNDSLTGNSGGNLLSGGLGNDTLDGAGGADYAIFAGTTAATVNLGLTTAQATGYGTDTLLNIENLSTGSGNDNLTGNSGANTLLSGAGNDILRGLAGNDALYGGAGADRLTGASGRDLLYGGAADGVADVFVYGAITDSPNGATTRDVIYDFASGIDDIELMGIDANSALAGDQAFTWAVTTATANAVWYAVSGADLLLRGDVNGDAVYDFEIQIAGIGAVVAGDIIL